MRFRHGTAQCAASAASDGSTSGAQPWAARAQSGIHGWGLFARAAMAQDSMVIEYRGELVRRATADARERRYRALGRDCYLFNLNEHTVIDATLAGTIGRFTVRAAGTQRPGRNLRRQLRAADWSATHSVRVP